jgi:4-cresol dehydrogenase (hydroxylating) flavoprotein subunit
MNQRFAQGIKKILAPDQIQFDTEQLETLLANSTGLIRSIEGIGFPISIEEVRSIVLLATKYKVALYPISIGQNIGYGGRVPPEEKCFILSLERMKGIRDLDLRAGEVTLEPGVTQQELYEYLQKNAPQYYADMTGGPRNASVVGNVLEGGFGHTAFGEHRKHIANLEIVLGNNTFLCTGDYPSLGPNLASLFVQSNFGVVTALRIPLLLKQKYSETFTISFKTTEQFLASVEPLRLLRQRGIIQSAMHIGNAMRTFMSTHKFPDNLPSSRILTEAECIAQLSNPFVTIGPWMAMGGFCSDSTHIMKEFRRELVSALPKGVTVKFFTPRKLHRLKWFVSHAPIFRNNVRQHLIQSLHSLESLHGLMLGIPTDEPTKNIFWRSSNFDDLGLVWHSPVIRACTTDVCKLLKIAEPIFAYYKFEMPITFTLIDHEHFIVVFNFNFNKSDHAAVTRAHDAHKAFTKALTEAGIRLYRLGLLDDAHEQISGVQLKIIADIKSVLDPERIIAPGRYGVR